MNTSAKPRPAGVLIVAPERTVRRSLFNALDAAGVGAIHAARHVQQAYTLLAEKPELDAIALEFCGAATEMLEFGTWLTRTSDYRDVPVFGLLTNNHAGGREEPDTRPDFVQAWLPDPRTDANATDPIIQHVAAHPASDVGTADADDAGAAGVPGAGGARTFAFDADDREWIIATAEGEVIDVNAAFVENTGMSRETVRGTSLGVVCGEADTGPLINDAELHSETGLERVIRRPRRDGGAQLMRARMRLIDEAGQRIHITSLQQHGHIAHTRTMLNLLSRLHSAGRAEATPEQSVQLLMTALPLDFAGVYTALPESSGETEIWLQRFRQTIDESGVPAVVDQPILRRVMDGETFIRSTGAAELGASDPFIASMHFAAFAGVPLMDERRNVLGGFLAGSREPWKSHSLVPETLKAAASRFAFDMELSRARQQGKAQGLLDGLTRLPNRLLFNDRLETTMQEANRNGEMFALLFVDLDRFKSINDSLGHAVGDKVLVAVAKRLRSSVRGSDTVARFAGDEFTIALRHITQHDDVIRIAEKMVRLLGQPLILDDGSEMHVTASIGISFYPEDATTAEDLLKAADEAMYSAKDDGRNSYRVHQPQPDQSQQQRAALEARLRSAQSNDELQVHYQPQVSAEHEDIVGMEALVRWSHPELGMVSPGLFIPIAEETGLIISIGEWVLRTACQATTRWQTKYGMSDLHVSVNLSTVQLAESGLMDMVRSALADSGLQASSLKLEVTESINIKSVPNLMANLENLRELGCHLAIDDFGTGQSSLDYLKKVPADNVKIDQTFVRHIDVDPDDEAIINATIDMAHKLDCGVIAEGVETEAHRDFLCRHGCEWLQGYLFCRPLPHNRFETLLAERRELMQQRTDGAA